MYKPYRKMHVHSIDKIFDAELMFQGDEVSRHWAVAKRR